MKRFSIGLLLAVTWMLLPGVARAADGSEPPTPLMRSVQPAEVKAGETIDVEGEYLGKKQVTEVYLTAEGIDLKLSIVAQDDKKLKLKLPAKVAAGKYCLMVLTNRPIPNFIEQPVSLKVE